MKILVLIILIIILLIYYKLFKIDKEFKKIKENYMDMSLKHQNIEIEGGINIGKERNTLFRNKTRNLNAIKQKYNLNKMIIGYHRNFLEFDYDNLLDTIMKELLAHTELTYLSKKNYTNVFNMFIELGIDKNPLNFVITDTITSSNIYTDIHNNNIEVKPNIGFNIQNINFICQIDYVLLFTIINTSNLLIKEEQDINIFGLIDNYMSRNIGNNLRDYYDIKYNKKIDIQFYKNYNELYRELDKKRLDCIVIIDRLKNDYLTNLFFKYKNFMIFEIDMNIRIGSDKNQNLISYYNPVYLDLNIIKGYLPRKFLDKVYTTLRPDIRIFAISILLFCSSTISPETTYEITKYYTYKFQKKNLKLNTQITPFTENRQYQYKVDSDNLYDTLTFNQQYFNRYFTNHVGTNKFLNDVGNINYNPSPNCIHVWGKCTDEKLEILNKNLI